MLEWYPWSNEIYTGKNNVLNKASDLKQAWIKTICGGFV